MPSVRRLRPRAGSPGTERLVGRTRLRLAIFTLVLVTALLAAVGLVTATVAVGALDASVDRSLRAAAADAMAATVGESEDNGSGAQPGETDALEASQDPVETEEPGMSGDSGETDVAAGPTPQRSPAVAPGAVVEPDEHVPGSADTFFLVLDASGNVVSNPRRVALGGLPDLAAVAAARAFGEDLRNGSAAGAPVRVLTQPIVDVAGRMTGFLQSAFVLSLHRSQEDQIWQAILLVSLIGLFGAAVVTLLVTHRALSPIRTAFATERRFVAAASHELRTPVAVIRASAEILGREELVLPEGRGFVSDVISESDRMTRLIGDLLALSSVQTAAISMHPRQIDLPAFVQELARRARSMAASREVGIAVDENGPDHAWVNVDPERLEQLVMILVDNAVDHSPTTGTVRLRLGTSTEAGRSVVMLSVIDNGPGVPEAERGRVFEPFARLSGWRRTSTGTGLGLAVARALADRLGATVAVGDTPGGGAIFSVILRNGRPPA